MKNPFKTIRNNYQERKRDQLAIARALLSCPYSGGEAGTSRLSSTGMSKDTAEGLQMVLFLAFWIGTPAILLTGLWGLALIYGMAVGFAMSSLGDY